MLLTVVLPKSGGSFCSCQFVFAGWQRPGCWSTKVAECPGRGSLLDSLVRICGTVERCKNRNRTSYRYSEYMSHNLDSEKKGVKLGSWSWVSHGVTISNHKLSQILKICWFRGSRPCTSVDLDEEWKTFLFMFTFTF